jgi:metacaspase-1
MKKALLVGINDYPGSSNDLAGCVNDTANLRDLLTKEFGFEAGNIRVLTNKKASRDAILDGLADLVGKAAGGDTLVFHYSGHGSQVPDEDGDEESDRKDEIICPWDFSWDGCWIADDDLSDVFAKLAKDVHLEVLLDCCHSGTGTREIALGKRAGTTLVGLARAFRGDTRVARIRFMPLPAAMAAKSGAGIRGALAAERIGMMVKAKPRGLNHVLWAACKSNQYSADADIGGSPNGAFTWFFCDAVRKAGSGTARSALLASIRKGLAADGFDQAPQLECEKTFRDGGVFSAK